MPGDDILKSKHAALKCFVRTTCCVDGVEIQFTYVTQRDDAIQVLIGKPEGKRPIEDLELDDRILKLMQIGWANVCWIRLIQNRELWRAVVNTVMKIWVL
jgi:hypothetical protein